jgi:hypothetical protein
MLAPLTLAMLLGFASMAWAGPYLRTSAELSVARSTKECNQHAAKTLSDLRREGRLRVSEDNPRLGSTRDTTASVNCVFVGKNESKRDQWIFYISIASTNKEESIQILKLLRDRLGRWERID